MYHAGQSIKLGPVGGCGTDFRPCFDWVAENAVQQEIVLFRTDLCGTLPEKQPSVEVTWAKTGGKRCPFGRSAPVERFSLESPQRHALRHDRFWIDASSESLTES